jgi:hypothetical protein
MAGRIIPLGIFTCLPLRDPPVIRIFLLKQRQEPAVP